MSAVGSLMLVAIDVVGLQLCYTVIMVNCAGSSGPK